MKITIYTINDCAFCVQEKDYLKSHNLAFEEKNLEVNREFLTEMLTISNNFAGTPVTKIEKDDESVVILKGFTKEEFDDVLGFAAPIAAATTPSVIAPPVIQPEVAQVAPVTTPVTPPQPAVAAPVMSAPAVAMPAAPVEPIAPAPVAAPVAPVDHASIAAQIAELQALQAKLLAQQAPVAPPAPVAAPVAPVVPTPPVVAQPAVVAPVAPPAPPQSVDDSLASILAELQSKINTQQPTPPAQS